MTSTSPQIHVRQIPVRLTRRGRRFLAILMTFGVLVAGGVTAGVTTAVATAAPEQVEVITVQAGDTLWGLAVAVYPDRDPRAGVSLLRDLNPALAATELAIGQRLVIRP